MVGTKAAPVNGLTATVRHGLLEPAMRWLDGLDYTTPARQLSITRIEQAWYDHAEPDRTIRDPGATPLRGLRLT